MERKIPKIPQADGLEKSMKSSLKVIFDLILEKSLILTLFYSYAYLQERLEAC
jgi:hypothetical protein